MCASLHKANSTLTISSCLSSLFLPSHCELLSARLHEIFYCGTNILLDVLLHIEHTFWCQSHTILEIYIVLPLTTMKTNSNPSINRIKPGGIPRQCLEGIVLNRKSHRKIIWLEWAQTSVSDLQRLAPTSELRLLLFSWIIHRFFSFFRIRYLKCTLGSNTDIFYKFHSKNYFYWIFRYKISFQWIRLLRDEQIHLRWLRKAKWIVTIHQAYHRTQMEWVCNLPYYQNDKCIRAHAHTHTVVLYQFICIIWKWILIETNTICFHFNGLKHTTH